MRPQDLIELFEYDLWATSRVLDAAERAGPAFVEQRSMGVGSTRDLMVHLGDAQLRWLERIRGQTPAGAPLDRLQSVSQTREHCQQANQSLRDFVGTLSAADLERVFQYRSLNGSSHTSRVREILLQLFSHGVHHRAEACELLSRAGCEPEPVELIIFYRSRG